jgi:hypothetical protein
LRIGEIEQYPKPVANPTRRWWRGAEVTWGTLRLVSIERQRGYRRINGIRTHVSACRKRFDRSRVWLCLHGLRLPEVFVYSKAKIIRIERTLPERKTGSANQASIVKETRDAAEYSPRGYGSE